MCGWARHNVVSPFAPAHAVEAFRNNFLGGQIARSRSIGVPKVIKVIEGSFWRVTKITR